jgi:hypothetical protein
LRSSVPAGQQNASAACEAQSCTGCGRRTSQPVVVVDAEELERIDPARASPLVKPALWKKTRAALMPSSIGARLPQFAAETTLRYAESPHHRFRLLEKARDRRGAAEHCCFLDASRCRLDAGNGLAGAAMG